MHHRVHRLIKITTEYTEFHGVIVTQSVAKSLGDIHVDVLEVLPPFGRLDDKKIK